MDWLLTQYKTQIAAGSALASTPIWVSFLQTTSLIAGTIAAVAGAFIAVNGAWKIYKEWRDKRNNAGRSD